MRWDAAVREHGAGNRECTTRLIVNYSSVDCVNTSDRLELKELSATVCFAGRDKILTGLWLPLRTGSLRFQTRTIARGDKRCQRR